MPKMSKKGGGGVREIPQASRQPMGHAEDYTLFCEMGSHWTVLSKCDLSFKRMILTATSRRKHKVL